MIDKAKMIGFLGHRSYTSEGKPQHRRKGGIGKITNKVRRAIDKKLCTVRVE